MVGLTLESGAPAQALGAFLLFVANVSAILAMGLLVMTIYRISGTVSPAAATSNKPAHRRRGVIAIVAALVVIAVPLTISSSRISHTRATESPLSPTHGPPVMAGML